VADRRTGAIHDTDQQWALRWLTTPHADTPSRSRDTASQGLPARVELQTDAQSLGEALLMTFHATRHSRGRRARAITRHCSRLDAVVCADTRETPARDEDQASGGTEIGARVITPFREGRQRDRRHPEFHAREVGRPERSGISRGSPRAGSGTATSRVGQCDDPSGTSAQTPANRHELPARAGDLASARIAANQNSRPCCGGCSSTR
jgi:hypothetical protein